MRFTKSLTIAVLISLISAVAWAQPAVKPKGPDASKPAAKKDNGQFLKKHQAFLDRAKAGPIGLLFLGDSITEGWGRAPQVWAKYYEKFQPANFGIGGDATQHVLWRIDNGELDGISPKVVVLMLGTNNTGANDGPQIAAADKKIVTAIRPSCPRPRSCCWPSSPAVRASSATAAWTTA